LKLNEIAKAYGISRSAVEKWSPTKRQQAIRLLSAGVNPQIMELVGEVQRLCYAASMVLGETVVFRITASGSGMIQVYYYLSSKGELARVDVVDYEDLTVDALSYAIGKLELIING
jgi:hypothetical protein